MIRCTRYVLVYIHGIQFFKVNKISEIGSNANKDLDIAHIGQLTSKQQILQCVTIACTCHKTNKNYLLVPQTASSTLQLAR